MRRPAAGSDPVVMVDDPAGKTQALIDRLRERGYHAEADHLAHQRPTHLVERAFVFALREACETILTAIEAIDPVTQTLIEELRLEVENRLEDVRQPPGWCDAAKCNT